MKKTIYLDYAATTPTDPAVVQAMLPYFGKDYGNPSSIHQMGFQAKEAIERARKKVAGFFGCKKEEIVFTGSGTESVNLAILGVARAVQKSLPAEASRMEHGRIDRVEYRERRRGHIITSKIEHHAVLHACQQLEKEGYQVTYLPVDKKGLIKPEQVEKSLQKDTILVSIIYVNNEIGTIQPIAKIAKIIADHRRHQPSAICHLPILHTDACQATCYLPLKVNQLGVDLLSINGSKVYGPKGIAALFVKNGIKLKPVIYGGGQEKGRRSGTENVPGIVGLSKALELADKHRETEVKRLTKLRDYLIEGIEKKIPAIFLNGDRKNRVCNNVNFSFQGIEGESIVLYLDGQGIEVSTGSACASTSLTPSHVILALGVNPRLAQGSVRFSLGKFTVKGDIDYLLEVLPPVIKRLREISPFKVIK